MKPFLWSKVFKPLKICSSSDFFFLALNLVIKAFKFWIFRAMMASFSRLFSETFNLRESVSINFPFCVFSFVNSPISRFIESIVSSILIISLSSSSLFFRKSAIIGSSWLASASLIRLRIPFNSFLVWLKSPLILLNDSRNDKRILLRTAWSSFISESENSWITLNSSGNCSESEKKCLRINILKVFA